MTSGAYDIERPESSADPGGTMGSQLRHALERAVDERAGQLTMLRRRVHAAPEPSGEERETSLLVANALRAAGYEPRLMRGSTGVIADLHLTSDSTSFIALRAELDSVRTDDEKDVLYASTNPGLCHACGHDAHIAMNVTAAAVLAALAPRLGAMNLRHNLRFIFQPAEETAAGARSMIEQGALDHVAGIVAQHAEPFLDVGVIGFRPGALTVACRSFEIVVRGRSGHSARPHEAIDPIPAATTIVDLLYQLAPRSIDSRYALSVTVGSIQAGSLANVIPDEARISGTLRAARAEDMDAVEARLRAILRGAQEATGCETEMTIGYSCPPTDNDATMIATMAHAAEDVVGPDGVKWLEVPSLGGEDFAYYQQHVPGAIVRLGAALDDPDARRPLHSSMFDINERALTVGTKFMCTAAVRLAAHYEGETVTR